MPSSAHHRPVRPKNRRHARSLRRQVPFRNYILDFVCFEPRVVIEIDGSQHLDSRADATRDTLLAKEGFHVARYWNNDVLQRTQSVAEHLFALLARDKA